MYFVWDLSNAEAGVKAEAGAHTHTRMHARTHTQVLLGDNTKLRRATGWEPVVEFRDTLEEVLRHWRREVKVRFGLI